MHLCVRLQMICYFALASTRFNLGALVSYNNKISSEIPVPHLEPMYLMETMRGPIQLEVRNLVWA